MRAFGVILLIGLFVWGVIAAKENSGSDTPSPPVSRFSQIEIDRMVSLRDEALDNIGWVAGNAYGRPLWPKVQGFVGEGGSYYEAFVAIAPEGQTAAQAMSNLARYKRAVELGKRSRYDERDMMRRIERVNQITSALTAAVRR